MYKKILIWILMLTLLVPFVFSVPPVQTTFTGETSLTVQTAPPRFLKINSIGSTTIHVFNTTNGVLMTNNSPGLVECNALIQWPNGTEIVSRTASPHEDHFDFTLDLTNTSMTGEYGWVMYCNNSNQEGYTSGYFELTNSGNEDKTVPISIFYFISISLIVLLLGISIYGIIASKSILGRYIFVVLTYIFFIAVTYINWSMADTFISTASWMVWFLRFLFMFSMWVFLPFFLISLTVIMYYIYQIKQIKGLVETGMSEEEAKKRIKG